MANVQGAEWEAELEDEFESQMESEFESHEGSNEFESELESHETAHEFESELEAHELGAHESHETHETHELESEFETGEQFFGRIARGIGSFVRRAAPILRQVARVAAPMVGTAIGGPFGAILGRAAASALGEGEFEQHEFELESHEAHEHHELEFESEFESHEVAHEVAHEIAHHEIAHHEALAEMMAEAAAHEQHEGEAEAMAGAAAVTVLSPADRRALRRLLPHLVRGTAVLTRILRRRRVTRPAVRAVPTIMRRTVRQLKRQAAAGQPITRKAAARAAATQVRRVLGNPSACAAAIQQNVRAARKMRPRPVAG
jgi:hypothetical protein